MGPITRVLVVEDDNINRAMLRMMLDQAGYTVEEATNGKSALARLRRSQERLVALVDLRMPIMDGVQLLEEVAADAALAHQHAYILVSASLDMSLPFVEDLCDRLQAPQLIKPYKLDDLLGLVRDAAERLT